MKSNYFLSSQKIEHHFHHRSAALFFITLLSHQYLRIRRINRDHDNWLILQRSHITL